jgi:hypothetical protein
MDREVTTMKRIAVVTGILAVAGALLFAGLLAAPTLAQQGPPRGAPAQGAGYGPGPWMGQFGASPMHAAIAGALGLTSEQLWAERQAGKSIASIAQERQVDLETVAQAALGVRKAHLEALVAGGQLTREQADVMLAQGEAMVRAHLNGTWGPGFGMMGPGHGMMGPRGGAGPGYGPGMGPGFGPRWGAAAP